MNVSQNTSQEWMPREEWDRRVRGSDCPLCAAIKTSEHTDAAGYTVADLERSKLRLMRNQYIPGYCVLIANSHVVEPFEMYEGERRLFFEDMTRAARAISEVFQPLKVTYEILGMQQPHLHVHLIPRYYGDPGGSGPADPTADERHLDQTAYVRLVGDLREALGLMREPVADPLLANLLDEQGRVTAWPTRRRPQEQMAVLRYLAAQFTPGKQYTEREVNALLKQYHTFEDWAMLRRELFERRFLGRMKDGSAYWLETTDPPQPDETE